MNSPSTKSFSATLRLPVGHTTPPVLEAQISSPGGGCDIYPASVPGLYILELGGLEGGGLEGCGVRSCVEGGEEWLCLLVRFPLLKGMCTPL